MKQSGLECNVSDQVIQNKITCVANPTKKMIKPPLTCQNIKLSLLMYASYFVLFGRFFYNAYLRGPSGDKVRTERKGSRCCFCRNSFYFALFLQDKKN